MRSEILQRFLTGRPDLSIGVLHEVGSRLRGAHGRAHSLAAHTVPQRVAEYLLGLAEAQAGPNPKEPVQVRLTMTHQELGSYLGASRESVTRALSDIRRDGAVRAAASDTFIVDPIRLRAFLQ